RIIKAIRYSRQYCIVNNVLCKGLPALRFASGLTTPLNSTLLTIQYCLSSPSVNETLQAPCLKGLWPKTLNASLKHVAKTPTVSIFQKHQGMSIFNDTSG